MLAHRSKLAFLFVRGQVEHLRRVVAGEGQWSDGICEVAL